MSSPAIILTARPLGLRQPEPPEGRKALPLLRQNGQRISFPTGNEVFTFNSANMGQGQPSAILSLWCDATLLEADGEMILTTQYQIIYVLSATQGYFVVTAPNGPFEISIAASKASSGPCPVILYNYNVLYTGSVASAPAVNGQGSGGGSYNGPIRPGG